MTREGASEADQMPQENASTAQRADRWIWGSQGKRVMAEPAQGFVQVFL